jgi:hypothetical protein
MTVLDMTAGSFMTAGVLGQLLSSEIVGQSAAWHGCWRAGSAVVL